jgi:hypothetical protein
MYSICFIVVVLISAVTPQTGGGTDGPSGLLTSVKPVPCNAPDRAIVTPSSTSQCGAYPTYVALHHNTKWLSGTFLHLNQIRLDSC